MTDPRQVVERYIILPDPPIDPRQVSKRVALFGPDGRPIRFESGTTGADGTFRGADGETVTVVDGLITTIAP